MLICFITHYSSLYGANQSLIDALKGFRKLKSDIQPIVLVPSEGLFTIELEKLAIPFYVQYFEANIYRRRFIEYAAWPSRFVKRRKFAKNLENTIRQISPDIIHSNSSIIEDGYTVAKRLKIPHVWHIREMPSRHYGLSFDSTFYGHKRFLKRSTKIISVSNYIHNYIRDYYHVDSSVIYNGIISEEDLYHIKYKSRNNRLIFGIVGLIHPSKNQLFLIAALANILKTEDYQIHVYGEGVNTYIQEILKFIETKKIKVNVHFKGFVLDKKEIYNQMDFLITASRYEAMGRTLVEANAFGVPVIANSHGGHIELIKNGVNGYLYKDQNMDDFLNVLARVIALKDDQYQEMSKNCIEIVRKKFTSEIYASKLYDIYKIIYSRSIEEN